MAVAPQNEFDQYASDYAALVGQSVGFLGNNAYCFARHKALYVKKILGANFSGRILDFGCGVGLLSRAMHEKLPKASFFGCDLSEASIAVLEKNRDWPGVYATDLEKLTGDFEVVIISNVLHHMPPEDHVKILRAIKQRTIPGAKIFIFEHNPFNPVTRRIVAKCPFDRNARLILRPEAIKLMEDVGCKVAQKKYIMFIPPVLSFLWNVEHLLGWCPLGAQYLVVAETA